MWPIPSQVQFRIEEKIHSKAVANVSRGAEFWKLFYLGDKWFTWGDWNSAGGNYGFWGNCARFRSKFNHGYLHCVILKALYEFEEKRARKARNRQFLFQNVQLEIFKILKMFKNSMKFTQIHPGSLFNWLKN